jgi:hypothetical protein
MALGTENGLSPHPHCQCLSLHDLESIARLPRSGLVGKRLRFGFPAVAGPGATGAGSWVSSPSSSPRDAMTSTGSSSSPTASPSGPADSGTGETKESKETRVDCAPYVIGAIVCSGPRGCILLLAQAPYLSPRESPTKVRGGDMALPALNIRPRSVWIPGCGGPFPPTADSPPQKSRDSFLTAVHPAAGSTETGNPDAAVEGERPRESPCSKDQIWRLTSKELTPLARHFWSRRLGLHREQLARRTWRRKPDDELVEGGTPWLPPPLVPHVVTRPAPKASRASAPAGGAASRDGPAPSHSTRPTVRPTVNHS